MSEAKILVVTFFLPLNTGGRQCLASNCFFANYAKSLHLDCVYLPITPIARGCSKAFVYVFK